MINHLKRNKRNPSGNSCLRARAIRLASTSSILRRAHTPLSLEIGRLEVRKPQSRKCVFSQHSIHIDLYDGRSCNSNSLVDFETSFTIPHRDGITTTESWCMICLPTYVFGDMLGSIRFLHPRTSRYWFARKIRLPLLWNMLTVPGGAGTLRFECY